MRIISHLFDLDREGSTRMCPKLTTSHIYPTAFEKMSVRLAVQVLSHSVASGILTLLAIGKFPKDLDEISLSTAKFLKKSINFLIF